MFFNAQLIYSHISGITLYHKYQSACIIFSLINTSATTLDTLSAIKITK